VRVWTILGDTVEKDQANDNDHKDVSEKHTNDVHWMSDHDFSLTLEEQIELLAIG
jgi:hypothetical protein